MKVVGYCRVSTLDQVKDGYGLDVQRGEIERWAKANGHEIVHWCQDEDRSGADDLSKRMGLAAALRGISSTRARAMVVARLDRLARDLVLQEQLLAEIKLVGGRVFSTSASEDGFLVDDPADPARKLIRQVLGAVAEYERSLIRLRLSAGRARKKSLGGYAGGRPPFGWTAQDGELVPDEVEQEVIRRIAKLDRNGLNIRQICVVLQAEHHLTKDGARWHPGSVKRILDRLKTDRVARAMAAGDDDVSRQPKVTSAPAQ